MFDEQDKSAGLIGTVEYGIDEFLMTEEGDLWKRDQPDITLTRYCHLSQLCKFLCAVLLQCEPPKCLFQAVVIHQIPSYSRSQHVQ